MTRRERAFQAMKDGSLIGIEQETMLYGIPINSMTKEELFVALCWSLSQNARLMPRSSIGIIRKDLR